MTATTILERLPSLLVGFGISGTAEVHRFSVAGRMQKRTHSAATALVVAAAKPDKEHSARPFWDALFRQLPGQAVDVQADVLMQAKYHHSMAKVATSSRLRLQDAVQIAADLDAEVRNLHTCQILALSSRLIDDRAEEWHIPMLDYRIPVTPDNEVLILAQLGRAG